MNKFIPSFTEFVNEDFDNVKSSKTLVRDIKKMAMSSSVEQELSEMRDILGGLLLKYFGDHVSALHKWQKYLFADDKNDIKKVINALKVVIEDEDKDEFTKVSTIIMNHLNQSAVSKSSTPEETEENPDNLSVK